MIPLLGHSGNNKVIETENRLEADWGWEGERQEEVIREKHEETLGVMGACII